MKNAIGILKQSLENNKSEAIRLEQEYDKLAEQADMISKEISIHICRITELELAIIELEGKENNEQTTSKSKKTKRSSSNT